MNTSERLSTVQQTLASQGVVDVKFYFERGRALTTPASEVTAKVADFMEAYLTGRWSEVDGIGDSHRKN